MFRKVRFLILGSKLIPLLILLIRVYTVECNMQNRSYFKPILAI
jgi:hypothetical protein